ncbi:MAG: PIN domain-containing protein [Desulfitobacterium hafniense]|nr:PIN domain-containing protein [Clostridium sp.]MDA8228895.1 PIN domain-containing protein [Desulfitobacterium hafniense]
MEIIMVDTSAIYALLDQSDNNHKEAKVILGKLSMENVKVILTNFLVAECHALIIGRLGHELARKWLINFCWEIERITEADEIRAKEIIYRYSDKSFTYTDATTFAVMERLGVKRCFSFDKHFERYGLTFYK